MTSYKTGFDLWNSYCSLRKKAEQQIVSEFESTTKEELKSVN